MGYFHPRAVPFYPPCLSASRPWPWSQYRWQEMRLRRASSKSGQRPMQPRHEHRGVSAEPGTLGHTFGSCLIAPRQSGFSVPRAPCVVPWPQVGGVRDKAVAVRPQAAPSGDRALCRCRAQSGTDDLVRTREGATELALPAHGTPIEAARAQRPCDSTLKSPVEGIDIGSTRRRHGGQARPGPT